MIWEQEAASSSLATPTTRKATMNRLQMRFCRGFLCSLHFGIQREDALFAFLRFIAIFKNSAYQNGIFAICSLRMLLVHEKRKLL